MLLFWFPQFSIYWFCYCSDESCFPNYNLERAYHTVKSSYCLEVKLLALLVRSILIISVFSNLTGSHAALIMIAGRFHATFLLLAAFNLLNFT